MSKFKINLELTGLKLNIEGSREDIPLITQGLAQQLTGLIAPAAAIASGDDDILDNRPPAAPAPLVHEVKKRKKRVAPARGSGAADSATEQMNAPIDFRHDPVRYGAPKQAWKTADKSVWLLHVVGSEMSGAVIVATFNKHFRQAGTITVSNANRDLGRLKGKSPAVVGEDTTKNPPQWFLTEEGTRQALKLVGDALGRAAA